MIYGIKDNTSPPDYADFRRLKDKGEVKDSYAKGRAEDAVVKNI